MYRERKRGREDAHCLLFAPLASKAIFFANDRLSLVLKKKKPTVQIQVHTILDAGTGNGAAVRLFREYGKAAYGVELSKAVLEMECPDLLKRRFVEPGVLSNLPYVDNSFDLVFSADVLEHIHPDEADMVVSELVRVSRRHIFLSISLKAQTKMSARNSNEAHRY